jgi:hypothetical protein
MGVGTVVNISFEGEDIEWSLREPIYYVEEFSTDYAESIALCKLDDLLPISGRMYNIYKLLYA